MTGSDPSSGSKVCGVLMVGAYFNTGEDLDERNGAKFVEPLKLKRTLGLPAILCADFNATPVEIREKLWEDLWDVKILAPECEFTCHSAGTKRIVDFCLVSDVLLNVVKVTVFPFTPWGPHKGLQVTFSKQPIFAKGRQYKQPKALPDLEELKGGKMFDETTGEIVDWEEAPAVWKSSEIRR